MLKENWALRHLRTVAGLAVLSSLLKTRVRFAHIRIQKQFWAAGQVAVVWLALGTVPLCRMFARKAALRFVCKKIQSLQEVGYRWSWDICKAKIRRTGIPSSLQASRKQFVTTALVNALINVLKENRVLQNDFALGCALRSRCRCFSNLSTTLQSQSERLRNTALYHR